MDTYLIQVARPHKTITVEVAQTVGDLVNLLSPDVVVLGGGLVEAMPKLIVEEVERSANNRAMPLFTRTFEVCAAKLADDACILGAAAWAKLQNLESQAI